MTPLGIARLGSQFYIIWTVLNGLMWPILYLFYPETAGRSLEDIDAMFEAHPTVWVFRNKSMTTRKPSPSNSRQGSGDDVPTSPASEHVKTYSRNASAVELAPLANLRHRQAGGAPIPLKSMTPVETTLVQDWAVAGSSAGAVEGVETGAEAVEEDESADVMTLRLASSISPAGPHISSEALIPEHKATAHQ